MNEDTLIRDLQPTLKPFWMTEQLIQISHVPLNNLIERGQQIRMVKLTEEEMKREILFDQSDFQG